MQQLIDDLLAFARLGRLGEATGPVDCGSAAQEALDNLATVQEETDAVVTVHPLPTLVGDYSRMVQLLQNLLANAIKFRSADRPVRIEVAARPSPEGWQFSVSDNGIGIEAAYVERIFAIFQRLHVREEYSGTGIGLAICRKIVEQAGGRIWVDSAFGVGSTFRWTMPGWPDWVGDDGT